MTKEELKKETEEYLDERCKDCYMCSYDEHKDPYRVCQRRKDRKQAYLAGAEPREKRIAYLELKIRYLTKHLEPQAMSALFEQVEEEVKQEQRIGELEAQIEKIKSDVIEFFGSEYNVLVAKLLKEWEIKEK